jgi:hypothetical protein
MMKDVGAIVAAGNGAFKGRSMSSPVELNLPFRPRARLLQLLGDQLIGTPRLAVFELVKNAYDADAELVTVVLNDLGGSFRDLQRSARL